VSPRGRRPGGVDTRAAIVDAARTDFAAQGYDGTSVRGVARRAGVDPALVHHYFGGKAALFAAVMDIPTDPAALIGRVVEGPPAQVGERLVRAFLTVWDSADGQQRFSALIRSAVTHEEASRVLREFLTREVFGRVVDSMAAEGKERESRHELELRAGLAASQMVGLALMRYIVRFPAVVTASHDDLVAQLGPTLQRYLAPDA
jgi:AcrR family transcriptional regulator